MYLVLLLRALLFFPFFALLRLVKAGFKCRKLWIFSSWMGMRIADNPKHLYSDLHEIDKTISAYFILKDKKKCDGKKVVYHLSIKGLYLQAMAEVCFLSHSMASDFLPFYIRIFPSYKVQMWHGSPYKKIMKDVPCSYLRKLKQIVFDKYDLYVCANDFFKELMVRAFDDNPCKFIASGLPRVRHNHVINKNHTGRKKILYVPTFRDNEEFLSIFEHYFFDFVELDEVLEKESATFYIRLHPRSKLSCADFESIQKCKNVVIDQSDDIYEDLNSYDLMITDYSSIIFDFYAYLKPVIFAPFDLEKYVNTTRGVYFSYESYSVKPYADDWQKFLELIHERLVSDDKLQLTDKRKQFGQALLGIGCSRYIYNEVIRRFYD